MVFKNIFFLILNNTDEKIMMNEGNKSFPPSVINLPPPPDEKLYSSPG